MSTERRESPSAGDAGARAARIDRILVDGSAGRDVRRSIEELPPGLREEVVEALAARRRVLGLDVAPRDGAVRVGAYRLVRTLGRGAQGSVHLATDERLGRLVALKLLDETVKPGHLRRFRQEAALASRLDHPAVATVYDAGADDGRAWIASRFVDGPSLAEWAAAKPGGRAPEAEVLPIAERLAGALAALHEAGVVHRDVKPRNVVLDPSGAPVLVDFGLAGTLQASATGDGGTPRYMSPEQIAGGGPLDGRSDVWSLGATLHEVLTGSPPYPGRTRDEVGRAIATSGPPVDAWRRAGLSRDLAYVLERALTPVRELRYPSARALADDLRRVREGRPLPERRAGTLERAAMWARRNPTGAAMIAALLVAVLLAAAGFVLERRSRAHAEGLLALAEARVLLARDPAAALARLEAGAGAAPETLAARALLEVADEALPEFVLGGHEGGARAARFALDGTLLATLDGRGVLRGFDLLRGGSPRPFDAPPDGTSLATAAGLIALGRADGSIVTFDARTGAPGAVCRIGTEPVTAVAWAPEGRTLAGATEEGRVALVEFSSGRSTWDTSPGTGFVHDLRFSPDGRLLAVAGAGADVLLLRAADGSIEHRLTHPRAGVEGVAFGATGADLWTASVDNTAWRFDAATGTVMDRLHGHGSGLHAVDARGAWLLTSSWDRTARLWDVAFGALVRVYRGHGDAVVDVAFDDGAARVATASADGEVRVWPLLGGGRGTLVVPGPEGPPGFAATDPAGRRLVTGSTSGEAVLTSLETGRRRVLSPPGGGRAMAAAFSPRDDLLVTSLADGTVTGWDAPDASAAPRWSARVPGGAPHSVVFDVGGDEAWLVGTTATTVLRAATGERLLELDEGVPGLPGAPQASVAGLVRRVSETMLRVGDAKIEVQDGVRAFAVSSDGRALVLGTRHGRVDWHDLTEGGPESSSRSFAVTSGPLCAVAVDRSGGRFAAATEGGDVHLFDARSGVPLFVLRGHDNLVYTIDFSADGRRAVTAGWDGRAIVWDLASRREIVRQEAHAGAVISARFLAGRDRVVSVSVDGAVRVWSADPLADLQGRRTNPTDSPGRRPPSFPREE